MSKKIIIKQSDNMKFCYSDDYNYIFDKNTGFFARWGKTKEDDPIMAPFPEIADIEISTICQGVTGEDGVRRVCNFCYKSNTSNGKNMSFETFKNLFDKLPPSLTQIAFGADSRAESNPDLWKMMEYCRENGVIPNITVAEITDETADKLSNVCGAVAVSKYSNKDVCYDSVKKLTDRGMPQINIHFMLSSESFEQALEVLNDKLIDPRLEKLNAIVFLSLKRKGRGVNFTPLSQEKFKQLVDFSMENNISIGFDSCSAYKYLDSVKDHPDFEKLEMYSEPCESSIFSSYFNVESDFFPCSFSENSGEWKEGISMKNCGDFSKDVWNHPKTIKFREKLLKTISNNNIGCIECPLFKV
jgi:hypothetical protein